MNAITRTLSSDASFSRALDHAPVLVFSKQTGLISGLIISIFMSALSVVTLADNHRKITETLSLLQREAIQLQTQQGQLLLEKNTLSSPSHVEKLAENTDGMMFPTAQQVVMINP